MIQHVYEKAAGIEMVSYVAVATDDKRIFDSVNGFGGRAVMTSRRHRSGTDRIAEATENLGLEDSDIVVNIQGDQPLFVPIQIEEVARPLIDDTSLDFSTLIIQDTTGRGDSSSERRQGCLRQGPFRPLFLALHDPPTTGTAGNRYHITNTTASTGIAGRSCEYSPPSKQGCWRESRPSNNSGRWRTATG